MFWPVAHEAGRVQEGGDRDLAELLRLAVGVDAGDLAAVADGERDERAAGEAVGRGRSARSLPLYWVIWDRSSSAGVVGRVEDERGRGAVRQGDRERARRRGRSVSMTPSPVKVTVPVLVRGARRCRADPSVAGPGPGVGAGLGEGDLDRVGDAQAVVDRHRRAARSRRGGGPRRGCPGSRRPRWPSPSCAGRSESTPGRPASSCQSRPTASAVQPWTLRPLAGLTMVPSRAMSNAPSRE